MKTEYASTLEFLYSQIPAFHRIGSQAYKPGLERVLTLSAFLTIPTVSYGQFMSPALTVKARRPIRSRPYYRPPDIRQVFLHHHIFLISGREYVLTGR